MTKNNIRYDAVIRDHAIKTGCGLFTVELIYPGKRPGKFGPRITLQGPADADEVKAVGQFLKRRLKHRVKVAGGSR